MILTWGWLTMVNKVTIGLRVPYDLRDMVDKPREIWEDLSSFISELAQAAGKTQTELAEYRHPLARELLKVMP